MIIANIIRGIPFMPLFVINIFKANANIAVKPRILLLGNPNATPFAIAVQIIAAKKQISSLSLNGFLKHII